MRKLAIVPKHSKRIALVLASSLMITGCISLGSEPPPSLLNLTADERAPIGSEISGTQANALIVLEPNVPAKIDVLRVPVQVSPTQIAYLQEAIWIEKPARLFRRLLAETMRTQTSQLIIESDVPTVASALKLSGTLREFGYDATNGSVIIQFDAERENADGVLETRRFEASEQGVVAEAVPVGAALNRAANILAGEVANWALAQ